MYHVELNPYPLYSEDSYEQIQNITPWETVRTGKIKNMTNFKNLSKNPWLTKPDQSKKFEYDNDGDDVFFDYNTGAKTNYYLFNRQNNPSYSLLAQDNPLYMESEFKKPLYVDPEYSSYYAKNNYGSGVTGSQSKAGSALVNKNVYSKKTPVFKPIERMFYLNPYTGHKELNPKFVISPYGDSNYLE